MYMSVYAYECVCIIVLVYHVFRLIESEGGDGVEGDKERTKQNIINTMYV